MFYSLNRNQRGINNNLTPNPLSYSPFFLRKYQPACHWLAPQSQIITFCFTRGKMMEHHQLNLFFSIAKSKGYYCDIDIF
jgi:hypothetical protein